MKNCDFTHCPFQYNGYCAHRKKYLGCLYMAQKQEIEDKNIEIIALHEVINTLKEEIAELSEREVAEDIFKRLYEHIKFDGHTVAV